MLLYLYPQVPYTLEGRLAAWITETKLNQIRIAKHGDVFVVTNVQETVYLRDGTAFSFDEGTDIVRSFAATIERPSKVFEMTQVCFSDRDTPLLTLYDISSDGRKIGRFVKYTSLRDRKVAESIFKNQTLIEAGGGDLYWEMIKVLFPEVVS